jgi:hypothetical protein
VFYGNGDGTFQAAVNFPDDKGPTVVVVADFNGDGRADLVTSNFHADSVSILLGIPGPPKTLSIITTSLPGATNGAPYSEAVVATGGVLPYTFSVTGTLPTGLTLNTTTGVISGHRYGERNFQLYNSRHRHR